MNKTLAAAAAPFGFIALAVLLFANTWFSSCSLCLMGYGNDPGQFVWYLGWLPFALSRGINPILSSYMQYPQGANLMFSTSVMLPSLLLWPVTAAWGPVASYKVLSTVALAASAWAAYLMIGRYVAGRWAAAAGGLLYGFSPYMIAHANGHPNLTMAVFPPVAVLMLDEILGRQQRSPWLLGAGLGAASALQLVTGAELLATSVLMLGAGVAFLAWRNRHLVRQKAAFAARAAGAAAGTFVLLAGVPLGYFLFGPRRVHERYIPRDVYVNDLESFVVPTRLQAISPAAVERISRDWTGNLAEWNGYVGLPLLFLAALVAWRLRGRKTAWLAGAAAAAAAILSMGPFLHVGGRSLPVPLPWIIAAVTPVVQDIAASRLMLFGYLALGLLIAVFLDAFRERPRRRLAALGVTALVLAPMFPSVPFARMTPRVPPAFTDGTLDRLPQDTVALVTPLKRRSAETMLWQALSGYRFKMTEGRIHVPGWSKRPASGLVAEIERAERKGTPPRLTPSLRAQLLGELRQKGAQTVIVGPGPGRDALVQLFTGLLGRPPDKSGGIHIWWPDQMHPVRS